MTQDEWDELVKTANTAARVTCDYCNEPEDRIRTIFVSGLKPACICTLCIVHFNEKINEMIAHAMTGHESATRH